MARRSQSETPASAHPWIPQDAPTAQQVETIEADPLWGDALALNGPSSPAAAPFVDVSQDVPWPVIETTRDASVCVMGLHGGAGASLFTHLIGKTALDTERQWPLYTGWTRPLPTLPVLAVARTHYEGVAAATRLARLWAAGALPDSAQLLGIVMVDDGPKLVKDQERAVKRVAQMVPNGWHVRWNETWRLSRPSYETAPARVRRIIDNIRSLAASTNGEQQ